MKKEKKSKSSTSSEPIPISEQSKKYHTPVLLKQSVDALQIQPAGIYVDCTFGGGGHARAILNQLGSEGKLVAFDQDEDSALQLPDDQRMIFVPHNFRHLSRFLRLHGIGMIDGILADLGVSSHHLDSAERGFSTRFDAPLDMRMDRKQSLTAAEVIITYDEKTLHRLFEQYGEVTNARTLAKKIVDARETVQLKTIDVFKQAIRDVVKGNPNKYFAQVFQAIRMEVNDELDALKALLMQIPEVLKPGGRAAIITFHSLEDRLVKQFFREGTFEEADENPFISVEKKKVFRVITKKPVLPDDEELKSNRRSRSAKLRIAEKI